MLAPDNEPTAAQVFRPKARIEPDGTVEGYASLFGEIDQARDMVMPGAFAQTLKARGIRRMPMLFQHDPSEPIGVWLDLREDFRGLYARGRLIPEVMRARELLALLRAGAPTGCRSAFAPCAAGSIRKRACGELYQVDLWEISIVTFPLLAGARVRAVKEARLPSRPASFARARAERATGRVGASAVSASRLNRCASHVSNPNEVNSWTSKFTTTRRRPRPAWPRARREACTTN